MSQPSPLGSRAVSLDTHEQASGLHSASVSPPSLSTDRPASAPRAHATLTHFAGLDGARDHHDRVVVDRDAAIVLQLRFEHTAQGWQKLRSHLAAFPAVAVAIETSSGAVVERLLEAGLSVFPVHPKAAQRSRDRKAPSGAKSDLLDAWSLADALRSDGHAWRPLVPEDPLLQELRRLCRDEVHLLQRRTALVNQLPQALYEYFPAAREAFDDWTSPAAWAFVERFPTPERLRKAGPRAWKAFLSKHGLNRPETFQRRLALFARAEQLAGSPCVTAAKSRLAATLAAQLRLLDEQLDQYRRRIEQLFQQHPDHERFGSLPGAGPKLAPRLLAETGSDRDRFDSHAALQGLAGSAPVSFQSGQIKKVLFRRACHKYLRAAVHLWSNLSRAQCAWAQTYYLQKRAQGKSHACALRCLAQRWLKILWKMWQTHTRYDERLHLLNQTRHGSWVVTLLPSATSPAIPTAPVPACS